MDRQTTSNDNICSLLFVFVIFSIDKTQTECERKANSKLKVIAILGIADKE